MTHTGTRSVELYLRTFSPTADAQRETVGRLEALAGDGPIDALEIERWSDRVELAEGDPVVAAFVRFREWAEQRDLSITPPFAIRTYQSAFTGETCDLLVTPVLFLASYVDGQIEGVFPHQDGDTVRTIDDFVACIERNDPVPSSPTGDAAVIR